MRAMFFNGSPRKNWNTAKLLESAMEGARSAGAEAELVNLYDIDFKGCKSCFACKLKNARTNGVCAIRDALRPVLERAASADVLVVGSPVYYSGITGVTHAFLERLMFPLDTYMVVDGVRQRFLKKTVPTSMILTMNVPENALDKWQYPTLLGINGKLMGEIFGYSETLFVCDTCQFADYSRYDVNLFSADEKLSHRDTHFAIELANAKDLGRRLVEKAKGK